MLTLLPKTIALIGASDDPEKLGSRILKNLQSGAFVGTIFPVNPTHDIIEGLRCYKSIDAIDNAIDLALIVTPASTVLAIAEACGKKKVKALVIISAGFGETGTDEGRNAERRLKEIGDQYQMTIIGPNCLGVLLPHVGLNASFAETPKEKGRVALISQSGAMAVALLDMGDSKKLGYSAVFSVGNKAHTDEATLIDLLAQDEKTDVIGLYVESISDGDRFVRAALQAGKPIVLLKAGVSNAGARAVSSHTGALAGSTAALDAACHAAGIRRAANAEEFFLLLQALATKRTLLSSSVAVITNAGGLGVLATDSAAAEGLELPALASKNEKALRKVLPTAASVHNPIDVLGDAKADRYTAALEAVANDPSIDGIACMVTPQVMTPCTQIAEAIVKVSTTHPLMPIVACFMGGNAVADARTLLRSHNIVSTETPEQAMHVLASMRAVSVPTARKEQGATDDDRSSAAHGLLQKQSGHLSDALSAELLSLYDLSMPDQEVAKTKADASEIATSLGFPVVLKVSSKDILHKTDVGGVKVNLRSAKDVEKAFTEIMSNCKKNAPTAGVHGVLVQKQMPAGSEFIVGALRDPAFGPIVMVGLGGIYTELFRDTVFRLAPLSKKEALLMLTELRSWTLLTGLRGKEPMDIDALAEIIEQVSWLITECEDITEIDLNPVLLSEESITIADVKIVVQD